MSSAHPGFKAVASKIAAKEGYSKERASAILAASTRKASPEAKKENPRLKRVKMGRHSEFEHWESKVAAAMCGTDGRSAIGNPKKDGTY